MGKFWIIFLDFHYKPLFSKIYLKPILVSLAIAIFISLYSSASFSEDNEAKTIAVMSFQNINEISSLNYLKLGIAEHINTYLVRTGRIKIVEREQLEKASLKELKLNLTDNLVASIEDNKLFLVLKGVF